MSPPHNTRSANISVSVINANDNLPHFNSSQYSLTVKENTPGGTPVGSVIATDADLGNYGVVSYALVGDDATLKK